MSDTDTDDLSDDLAAAIADPMQRAAMAAGTVISKTAGIDAAEATRAVSAQLAAQIDAFERGDFRDIERALLAQAATLGTLYDALIINASTTNRMPHILNFTKLALTAQRQSAATLAAAVAIRQGQKTKLTNSDGTNLSFNKARSVDARAPGALGRHGERASTVVSLNRPKD